MSEGEPKRALEGKLAEDYFNLISSVGLVTTAWAHLEETLFKSFQLLSNIPHGDWQAAGVIFYTPNSFESRLQLVDKLVAYRCLKHPFWEELDKKIFDLWASVRGKIQKLQNTRNRIIHGGLMQSTHDGNVTFRIHPALPDVHRSPSLAEWFKGHPGLGPNELNVHQQAVVRVAERVQKLNEVFQLRMLMLRPGNPADAIEKLRAVVTQLENQTNTQSNPDEEQLDKTDPSRSSQG